MIVSAAGPFESASGRVPERARRRLARRLIRLNEAALIIDGLLGDHAEIAHETHARLFEIELTVQNIGRLADALCDVELPPDLHRAIGVSLTEIRDDRAADAAIASLLRLGGNPEDTIGQLEVGRVTRLAGAIVDWRLALARWADRRRCAGGGSVRIACDVEVREPSRIVPRGLECRRAGGKQAGASAAGLLCPGGDADRGCRCCCGRYRLDPFRAPLLLGGDRGVHRVHRREHERRAGD